MSTEKGFYKEKPGGKIIYTEPMKCDHGIAICVKKMFTFSVLRHGEINVRRVGERSKSFRSRNGIQIENHAEQQCPVK